MRFVNFIEFLLIYSFLFSAFFKKYDLISSSIDAFIIYG
jgi:hypothetical protein